MISMLVSNVAYSKNTYIFKMCKNKTCETIKRFSSLEDCQRYIVANQVLRDTYKMKFKCVLGKSKK
jgi:hypothetical protein